MAQIALHDVFGVLPGAREHSYVDRGSLDEALRYASALWALTLTPLP